MPRAEVGSTKHVSNQMKSKGLQRLRWFCQVCERQMRDENGFKCHVASEAHTRNMLIVGENSGKFISQYSQQFKSDFLKLLKTAHGEKWVNLNYFYSNEYIRDKLHVHMNATRWASLTEFGKYLGREGICRVQEGDKGLEVAWIDNSPEALRRQDAIRKKERQDKGDEEREQKMIEQQVERAQRQADEKPTEEFSDEAKMLQREDGERLSLNFGKKVSTNIPTPAQMPSPPDSNKTDSQEDNDLAAQDFATRNASDSKSISPSTKILLEDVQAPKVGLSFSSGTKPKNVFAAASKKNALNNGKSAPKILQQKPMSEAERIMKEELQRKRTFSPNSFQGLSNKKAKT